MRQLSAEETEEKEYISPAFAIPKKDGIYVRIDFGPCKLNAMLVSIFRQRNGGMVHGHCAVTRFEGCIV